MEYIRIHLGRRYRARLISSNFQVVSNRSRGRASAEGSGIAMVAVGYIVGAIASVAVGAAVSLLWPAVAPVVMMKAPGGAGLLISRMAFEANPQLYYHLLHTAGRVAAAAAFAV
ncbi:Os07g0605350 [Oryza sativa Japonica Group]|uniref:Os07g0605350 protein n=4 Tax=Oryza TaxID=4527 RepID=Q6Z4F7_ORYSJ|nr:hypothetical protein EE612_040548 [Oryza sativa]BAC83883.1 hypothetical protein [Oryza sativa Japonica Group]BAT02561.1 Os07g0605350 [Oryza sativa Japonica Group]